MIFGILGSGSWGTALAKILTDNDNSINWWNRNADAINFFLQKKHNPHYLQAAKFDTSKINFTTNAAELIRNSDVVVVAVPSLFVKDIFDQLPKDSLNDKIIVCAIKGIIPQSNVLLNDYLRDKFEFDIKNYVAVLGPCHAEEIAAEKLSYLTFSGLHETLTAKIANRFKTDYLNTIVNPDIIGVQYAAVLKNIYAVGAGIAHGLDYGDNFLSVFIANAADEMASFLRKAGILDAEVGYIDVSKTEKQIHKNYAASVYLGDLLVTCYSLHSRNRAFGNMIGKGYSVKAAKLEMNMVAEGYHASKCMFVINERIKAKMFIANTIYKILWEEFSAEEGFKLLEQELV